jgi:hypothetical protein
MRNCTRDEGRPFEVGNQALMSSHRKLLWSKATVVNVAEKSEQDSGGYELSMGQRQLGQTGSLLAMTRAV